ncbi:transcriptional regulator [Streptomyces sp. NPDC002055]|uniref:transcriptional regulator n=1 Tax=Streptomyces sp. NPDC002055 TaxID=3154534 RepID=UPI0033251715
MYDLETRRRALALVGQGHSLNSVSRRTGISRSAIRSWRERLHPLSPASRRNECPRCSPGAPLAAAAYAYLLGLYLGDGCISAHPRGGYALRIACADAWPGLIEACRDAIGTVRPMNRICAVRNPGCTTVTCYSHHWPCLFPQHGPGKKHERVIALADWQQDIVAENPWEFIRGLMHSDGCRVINRTARTVAGERRSYSYPRYFFTNTSADILRLFTASLDRVGVEWRTCRRSGGARNISVARRASVALMDEHIGPKY